MNQMHIRLWVLELGTQVGSLKLKILKLKPRIETFDLISLFLSPEPNNTLLDDRMEKVNLGSGKMCSLPPPLWGQDRKQERNKNQIFSTEGIYKILIK